MNNKTGSSSRAPAPPPLHISNYGRAATSPVTSTKSTGSVPRSSGDDSYFASDAMAYQQGHYRKDSNDSTKKSPKSPKVNANSYCGRHSDEWLSVSKIVRSIIKKDH
ncbi:hypothetical protein QBC46DRAFT_167880 [Diplogelasinospora grovesii]|uniref:Uncharacterized protein n=1 Tax=Diplogelasinospora grovesii TaxID=303347 RepID=A0AAN6S393_9PEZI|nr:hypothetical protein QBC46DRAFT_167880 [Diplogelasinospora grovesii]